MAKHYHFIGIGGVGMGTLAALVLARGDTVSGSDVKENAMTKSLREKGASVFIGHEAAQVGRADVVVYSSAVPPENPEREAAEKKGIPVLQRARLLSELMAKQFGVTVVGAHGKTTTSAMTANLLIQAGLNPTTAIGGVINGTTYHAHLGDSRYFVAELDESDGSFLFFKPRISVITNLDFEHVDYYHTWDNILSAFRQFIQQTDPAGLVLAYGGDARLMTLLRESGQRFLTYGLSPEDDIHAEGIRENKGPEYFLMFEGWTPGRLLGEFKLRLPGRHNILNAMACIGVGLQLGIPVPVIQKSLESFQGVKRRFQIKGRSQGVMVVDDYGHHPTEIRATLAAALSLKEQRLITVFQPHRYTRTMYLMEEFVSALSLSDEVIITDIYAASEKPIDGVSAPVLSEKLKATGKKTVQYLPKDAIVTHLKTMARPGDMILTLGAGDVFRVGEELLEFLNNPVSGSNHLTGVTK